MEPSIAKQGELDSPNILNMFLRCVSFAEDIYWIKRLVDS